MPDHATPRPLPARARVTHVLLGALAGVLFGACSAPEPVMLGFIGGLSGRFADIGVAARNGALLAVEQANASGGIDGRPVQLVERDDGQDRAQAVRALGELRAAGVTVVVGPITSSIGTALAPEATAAGMVLVSPLSGTALLSGKDDGFFRVISDSNHYARAAARRHHAGFTVRKVALVMEMANADFSIGWSAAYADEMRKLGAEVIAEVRFNATESPNHAAIARTLASGRPDLVAFATSGVDTAQIAQRLKAMDSSIQLASSAWAPTGRLIELGGAAVEGMAVERYFDSSSQAAAYVGFVQAYTVRFGVVPEYTSTLAYDATTLALVALKSSRAGRTPREVLRTISQFNGLQGEVKIDSNGDATREPTFERIIDGRFVVWR